MNANYDYWQNALAGNFGAVHDEAQLGFFRKRASRSGHFLPVAIYAHPTTGETIAMVDGKPADAAEIWTYVCEHPIPETWYRDKIAGKDWPDIDGAVLASAAPPAPGGNNPPTDEAEILAAQIAAAETGAKDYAEIKDDETLAKAQSLRSRLLELKGEAEKKHKVAKAPALEAGRLIDKKWFGLRDAAETAAATIKKAMDAWVTAKMRAAEKAAAEEAARIAAAAPKPVKGAPPAAPPAAPAPAPMQTQVRGAYGRAASVQMVKLVTGVTDMDALYGFLKNHPEVKPFFVMLAQRAVKAGHTVPGVTIEESASVK